MKENGNRTKPMVKVSSYARMVQNMMESGKTINNTEMVKSFGSMDHHIKVSIKPGLNMAKE